MFVCACWLSDDLLSVCVCCFALCACVCPLLAARSSSSSNLHQTHTHTHTLSSTAHNLIPSLALSLNVYRLTAAVHARIVRAAPMMGSGRRRRRGRVERLLDCGRLRRVQRPVPNERTLQPAFSALGFFLVRSLDRVFFWGVWWVIVGGGWWVGWLLLARVWHGGANI